jgi:MFS family permease
MRTGPLRSNVDFRRYWIGQAASDLGSNLSLVAYPLLVLAAGGSAVQAGAIASASLLTRLVCRLPSGIIVDWFDRRVLLLAGDLIRAAALGSIPLAALFGGPGYPQIVAVAVVEGAATSVFFPAAMISVRQMVAPEDLTTAMARSQSRGAAAAMIGPAIGGWLFAVQRLVPFVADAVSYVVSAVMIARLTTRLDQHKRAGRPSLDVAVGFRWLAARPTLRVVFLFAGAINVISAAAVLVVVVTARHHGESSGTIGILMACVGAGAVLGTALAAHVMRWCSTPVVLTGIGLAWIGAPVVLAGVGSPWIVGPMLALPFVLSPSAAILVGKAMLVEAPIELQGRVATAADLIMTGLSGAGPLLAGILVDAVGSRDTWLVLGGIAAVATLACLPTFRRPGFLATPESPPSPQRAPEEPHDTLRQPR